MKSLFNRVLFPVVAALIVAVAGQAWAETLPFTYDFETCTIGNRLTSETGWAPYVMSSYQVYAAPLVKQLDAGDNLTKIAGATTYTDYYNGAVDKFTVLASYNFDVPLTFTSADTNVEQSFYGYVGRATPIGGIITGLEWTDQRHEAVSCAIGMMGDNVNSAIKMYFRSNASGLPEYYGDTLTAGHWYEIKAVMDFSDTAVGGRISMFYRDVTDDETDFTPDSAIVDIPMSISQTGGVYKTAYGFRYQASRPSGTGDLDFSVYMDNFTVQIPEPSTLALLATGLIGLLAYAWRKRK